MQYEAVIGLEVHVQLNTESKIFCGCATKFGALPNSQTCPVCQGHPGTLPVMNEEVLKKGVLAGLALNSIIPNYSRFDRKNYFYPDLPKAYQISQHDKPICLGGFLEITTSEGVKRIGITRLHLEEDAGKLIHQENSAVSYIDLNRAGVPLAEIVSEPDMRNADEAYEYLQTLKSIMKYIGVSDVNMEEGSLRCDVNISIREKGDTKLGQRVEIKNLNSFKAVKAAINYEFARQKELIEDGEKNSIVQETRLWNSDKNETFSMRSKESANDYRYFPDPDLPPLLLSDEYIEAVRKMLPELPKEKKARFANEYGLSAYDAGVLTTARELANYFEETVQQGAPAQKASNWIQSELLAVIDDPENIGSFRVTPKMLAELIGLIEDGTISGKIAKTLFADMTKSGKQPNEIVKEKGLVQLSDSSVIEAVIEEIITANPQTVKDFRDGKGKAMGFLVGQIMKASGGKANPQIVNKLLKEKLDKL
ncbi:MAG: Asp-tRNA(Asn)/Glu-tRNA(Gln) amidotransferase subunit GatB [Leptospirales bacterium]|nr:Asp-tRNA(Asn)/Glu-tRNA(Gln) amidotransferase subunit GatB [Leptospirales bacterium]